MNDHYKIIILVLAADGDYVDIVNASKNTWAKNVDPDVLVLFYYGSSDRQAVHLEGDNLICSHPEEVKNIGLKTIEALEFINKQYTYDYLVRCCAGSYMHIENLKKHLSNRPANNFCCGIGGDYQGVKYISGSCYILSRDAVESVVKNKNTWEHSYPDDVAIGYLLLNEGFELDSDSAKRADLKNSSIKTLRSLQDNYHFHFRNQPKYMYAIHKYFERKK